MNWVMRLDSASRVKAGEWLGPWVLCHTLEAVMKKMEPGSLHVHVHVVSQPGGAVPVLYTARSVALLHSRHPVAADATCVVCCVTHITQGLRCHS